MVFSSLPFLFFFLPVVLLVYYFINLIAPRHTLKNTWLFLASLFFYGYGAPTLILLILFSIAVNYLSGILIDRFRPIPGKQSLILVICISINLLLLGYFKYSGLLLDTARHLSLFSSLPVLQVVLPIGISFYTFQTLSYVIDVYRGNCRSQKNIITFGTYVVLFPQLIAGPIVRYVDIEDQLMHRRESVEQFTNGVRLFLIGLAKKVLLANQMGLLWDGLRTLGDARGLAASWFGIIAFTLQIYFDFSGYSDMARGLGAMFGFHFLKNFDYPYISASITEFWRRWHISLGTWFREYVYIPLGGNRRGKSRQCVNILIVWGLTGIWHGASWNFLLWGLYYGFLLILEKLFLLNLLKKIPAIFSHFYAMFFVILGWIIFEFEDISAMFHYIGTLFRPANGLLCQDAAFLILAFLPLLLIAVLACFPFGKRLYSRLQQYPAGILVDLAGTCVILFLCTASLVSSSYNPFLYFRF